MTWRRYRLGCYGFVVVLILMTWSFKPAALGQERANVSDAIKERDNLARQAGNLLAEGKPGEAIKVAEAVIAIERRVLGPDHEDVAGSLTMLAFLHEEVLDFSSAIRDRQDFLRWSIAHPQPDDWRTADARRALADTEFASKADATWRGKFHEGREMVRRLQTFREQGKVVEAIEVVRQLETLTKTLYGPEHLDFASLWEMLATLLRDQRDLAQAQQVAERAAALRKRVQGEHHPDYAYSLQLLAGILRNQNRFAEARSRFQQALAVRERALGERHPLVSETLNNLADLYLQMENPGAARPLLEKAAALLKERPEVRADYATCLLNLAKASEDLNDYATARKLYEQTLQIRQEIFGERHGMVSQALNNLANLFLEMEDPASARPLLVRAVAIEKEIAGGSGGHAAILDNLARTCDALGDYAAARTLFEQALEIRRKIFGAQHQFCAKSLNNLANSLSNQGDYAAARPLFEEALKILEKTTGSRRLDYASTARNLAICVFHSGDIKAASEIFSRVLELRNKLVGEQGAATLQSLHDLGVIMETQERYQEASKTFERVFIVRKEKLGENHPATSEAAMNLGILLALQGDKVGAKALLEEAVASKRRDFGPHHLEHAFAELNLGSALSRGGEPIEAVRHMAEALKIARENLDTASAAQSERQQIAMAVLLRGYLDRYLDLGLQASLPGDQLYNEAIGWKGSMIDRRRGIDRSAELAPAFDALRDVNRKLSKAAFSVPTPEKREAWKANLVELTNQREKIERELAGRSEAFRRSQELPQRGLEQVRKALPAEAALIDLFEYSAGLVPPGGVGRLRWERRIVAFIVRCDRPVEVVNLGPSAQIGEAVGRWLASPGVGPGLEAGIELRRLVWEKLVTHLDGARTILVSPDGPLCRLPLCALPGLKPGSYLIEEYAFAIIPAPIRLALPPTGPSDRTRGGLLVVGDVDFDAEPGAEPLDGSSRAGATTRAGKLRKFAPLEATAGEITMIQRLFHKRAREAEAVELSGAEANEAAIRREAGRHSYIHLATHGFFAPPELRSALDPDPADAARNGIDPFGGRGVVGFHPGLLSGIALVGANRTPEPGKDDGILTALEVAELDLAATDLVVLSACKTGLGESVGGEGLLGLQRAFQVAGARSVVASLWDVKDQPTRALMERFYSNLWQKGMTQAEALREAQLWMLREGASRGLSPVAEGGNTGRTPPELWAAFVLSGDWR